LKGGQVGRVAEIIGDDHPRDTGKDP
jgi:hypothetical protein